MKKRRRRKSRKKRSHKSLTVNRFKVDKYSGKSCSIAHERSCTYALEQFLILEKTGQIGLVCICIVPSASSSIYTHRMHIRAILNVCFAGAVRVFLFYSLLCSTLYLLNVYIGAIDFRISAKLHNERDVCVCSTMQSVCTLTVTQHSLNRSTVRDHNLLTYATQNRFVFVLSFFLLFFRCCLH